MADTVPGYGAAALELGLTRRLASFLAELRFEDLPAAVVHEARRGVLDWVGCALAGSGHAVIDKLLAVAAASGGRPVAPVIGRRIRVGALEAPLVNGQMGHVLDFDDTHMGGVVLHTSSPTLAALLALAVRGGISGRRAVLAYVAGFEAGVRAGQAAPEHHPGGWHLTGTLGAIAAGATAAKALGLDPQAFVYALGIATTQAAGMQQNRGTMSKSLHAGKAAHSGTLAALLAEQGFDASDEILEGRRGFCRIYSRETQVEHLVEGLGERWAIARNGHKPYACGVVLHPAIDAMVALGKRLAGRAAAVESIQLRVNPAAVTITGVVVPNSGLQAKFSLHHSAAVAFLDRTAGIAQYADSRAAGDDVVALRARVTIDTDPALARDQAAAELLLSDGSLHRVSVDHATGTADNPMSDAAIAAKFMDNAGPVLGAAAAESLRDVIWAIDTLDDVQLIGNLAAGL